MPIFPSERNQLIKKRAEELSEKLGHFYLGVEHIFLVLLDTESWFYDIITQAGVDPDKARERILNICGPGDEESLWKGIITTPRLNRVMKLAEQEALEMRAYRVEPHHVAAAICREGKSVPARVLESFNVDLTVLRSVLLKFDFEKLGSYRAELKKPQENLYSDYIAEKGRQLSPAHPFGVDDKESEKLKKKKGKTPTLDKLGRDLTEMARLGKIDPIVGRKEEIRRMLQTLTKKMKNNPIIIGEAGVGKTAVVYALAQRIAEGKVPDILADKSIIELSMSCLLYTSPSPRDS